MIFSVGDRVRILSLPGIHPVFRGLVGRILATTNTGSYQLKLEDFRAANMLPDDVLNVPEYVIESLENGVSLLLKVIDG